MNRVFKTFMLWLLIAALPIQGIAAVVQASCGPRHHAVSSASAGMVDHHHDGSVTPHSHSDMVGHDTDMNADRLADAGSDSESSSRQIQKISSCSACAACCFGAAAPPPSLLITPVLSTAGVAVLSPVVSFTGFIPASLERPPRHLSA